MSDERFDKIGIEAHDAYRHASKDAQDYVLGLGIAGLTDMIMKWCSDASFYSTVDEWIENAVECYRIPDYISKVECIRLCRKEIEHRFKQAHAEAEAREEADK